ncbi:unnamed protein product [Boreogadus saida]
MLWSSRVSSNRPDTPVGRPPLRCPCLSLSAGHELEPKKGFNKEWRTAISSLPASVAGGNRRTNRLDGNTIATTTVWMEKLLSKDLLLHHPAIPLQGNWGWESLPACQEALCLHTSPFGPTESTKRSLTAQVSARTPRVEGCVPTHPIDGHGVEGCVPTHPIDGHGVEGCVPTHPSDGHGVEGGLWRESLPAGPRSSYVTAPFLKLKPMCFCECK